MDTELSKWIDRELPELQKRPHVLSFSCGADSLASLIRMHRWGMKPELFYLYFAPGLPMIENYLSYIEDKLGQKIHRFPGKLLYEYLLNGLLQQPGVGEQMYEDLSDTHAIPKTGQINEYVMQYFPDDAMLGIGLRVSDGIFRAQKLRKRGPVEWEKREWYPVADCWQSDIVSEIKGSGFKLPVDYRLFGRSFESLRHWTAAPIRQHCPKTWDRLIELFPMAPLLCAQDSLLERNKSIDRRISAFGPLAFSTETCS
jgi:3'-phosphoadenosine 5'-phosphosulfate sulfotransferase (PAPS reductase)/FAD synthetase